MTENMLQLLKAQFDDKTTIKVEGTVPEMLSQILAKAEGKK